MDPASHRLPVSYLAKLTSGRCLSVRYRLAPQHPFPTAILDGLIAYLSLLSPTPDSYHTAVSPSNIVFAGDSAGGNLCLSLCQTLLTLQRKGIRTIRFHGRDVALSLPAGLALSSPWCDISRAMPSCHTNATYDYLIPPPDFGLAADLPPDDMWPTQPPRVDMYVNATALIHPLVSPIAAKPELWRGAPPAYMCAGTEALEDEIAVVARRMDEAGVYVQFDTYEGMPHCFGMIFPKTPMGRECMESWGKFILAAGDVGNLEKEAGERRRGKASMAVALKDPVIKREVKWNELKKDIRDEDVESLLRAKRERYMKKEEEMVRAWREDEEPGLQGGRGENVMQANEEMKDEQQQRHDQCQGHGQEDSSPAVKSKL